MRWAYGCHGKPRRLKRAWHLCSFTGHLQYQQLAKRYVIRGLESGGAVGDVGRYVTFAQEDGEPIEYLHPVEAIGVNGLMRSSGPSGGAYRHAAQRANVRVADYSSRPGKTDTGHRPPLATKVLFRGVHGRLELDLSGKDKDQAGRCRQRFTHWPGRKCRYRTGSGKQSVQSPRRSIAQVVPMATMLAAPRPGSENFRPERRGRHPNASAECLESQDKDAAVSTVPVRRGDAARRGGVRPRKQHARKDQKLVLGGLPVRVPVRGCRRWLSSEHGAACMAAASGTPWSFMPSIVGTSPNPGWRKRRKRSLPLEVVALREGS